MAFKILHHYNRTEKDMIKKTQLDTLQLGFPDTETRCVINGEFLRVDGEGLFVKRGEEEKLVAVWSNENNQSLLEMDKVVVTKGEAVATYKGNFEIVVKEQITFGF